MGAPIFGPVGGSKFLVTGGYFRYGNSTIQVNLVKEIDVRIELDVQWR